MNLFKNILLSLLLIALGFFRTKLTCADKETRTPEQQAALDKFRPMVDSLLYRDFMKTDEYLLKWLKVGEWKVGKTKTMLEKSLAWRKVERIDELLNEDLSKVEKCLKIYTIGHDREGRPVVYAQIGQWDIRKCALSGSVKQATRLAVRSLFESPQNNATLTGTYIIADLNGFNIKQGACLSCFPLYTALAYHFDHDYPGLVHRVNLINAPRAFDAIWSLITPILTPQSRDAMRIYSHNKKEWIPILLKDVDPEQLLTAYGGKYRI